MFERGEIHALLGENGAGKSTLANAIDGQVRPSSGGVSVPGTVGYVHQHFAIPPGLTSAECLAVEDQRFLRLTRGALVARFHAVEESTGIALGDPDAEAACLPVGARQRLEFARAISRRPDMLLLDEPTAALAPSELDAFFTALRRAAADGMAIVFITHKLPEVFAVADRLSLLRRGRLIFSRAAAETSADEIAALFLEGAPPAARSSRIPGRPVLVVEGLVTEPGDRGAALDGISIRVREREIVAIVGVDGNGQDEIADAITGIRAPSRGGISLSGSAVDGGRFRRSGASVVPGDRQREGLILGFSIADNLRLAEPIPAFDARTAQLCIAEYQIRAASFRQTAGTLSGGNQQKVVLARELARNPPFLLAISPTRGLDLAASGATFAGLNQVADRGGAVLLVTSDLDEARAVADVLHVLYRGRLSPAFAWDAPLDRIGRAMAGLAA
jgi:simple sugar transport system ATP-binding protein